MSMQSTGLQQGDGARISVRTRVVVAIGVALLVIGIVTWILIARARTPEVGSPAVTAPSLNLTLRDDYATRHLGDVTAAVPELSFRDDYATRHIADLSVSIPKLTLKDDYATRHLGG